MGPPEAPNGGCVGPPKTSTFGICELFNMFDISHRPFLLIFRLKILSWDECTIILPIKLSRDIPVKFCAFIMSLLVII